MRYRLELALAAAVLCATPLPARASFAVSSIGVGPHGYDFLIGTWSCKNTAPSALEGPSEVNATISRAANGALSFHSVGAAFEAMGYIVYVAKTKTWWNPSMLATGAYGTESSQGTGRTTMWSGPFTDPTTGKTMQVRDTYTFPSATTYTDLYQAKVGGTWKTEGNTTCTKALKLR
ncbi:MAG TPA: hypothetical protein VHT92_11980 [Candidatus Cybelea sp.]|jgi:hypothetical protein|nr:hypothetical protein [Candidatus Cybelea sp.]